VRNDKARRFLAALPPRPPACLEASFPSVAPESLAMLQRLLAFDPSARPTAAQLLADPYFDGALPLGGV